MDENKPGKRLTGEGGLSRGAKIAIGVTCGAVLALLATYGGLCAYVGSSGTVLPNTRAHGVELGGLTRAQAADALTAKLSAQFHGGAVTFTYPKDGAQVPVAVPGELVGVDAEAAAQAALETGRAQGFFAQGFHLMSGLVSGHQLELPLTVTDEAGLDAILDAVSADLGRPMAETTWAVEGEQLRFHTGVSGLTVDRAEARAQVLDAFAQEKLSGTAFTLEPIVEAPPALDVDAVWTQVYTEAADAHLDPETKEIVPAVTGVSFDKAEAQSRLSAAPEGGEVAVPLALTVPNMTTEKLTASLFKDVLGEATSRVSGSANRRYNVKLSAAACGEIILLPGDIFAYNETTGSRTAAKGYLPAPAYVGGLSVDELGGGICQTSSTIYYAALHANLKIVERQNHRYAVGYVPDGMDATVYFGSLDFRFQNNTEYPLKIVTESYDSKGSRYLTVKLLGTKVDDTYVKMTNREVSSIAPQTVYRADPSVPQGAAPRPDSRSTAYRGRKVEAYRNVYSADGTLISSTLESVNQYQKRDRVLLVNPADLAIYEAGGTPGAPPAPEVTPGAPPQETPAPAESPAGPLTPTPPPESAPPQETAPQVAPTPEAVPMPEAAPTPEAVPTPEAAPTPEVIPTPEAIATPTPAPVQEGGADV